MWSSRLTFLTRLILIASFVRSAGADDSLYVNRIRPLLKERCFSCHGALKQEAGLRLDTGTLIRKGSENGSVINTAAVDDSVLIERLSSEDDDFRMPPDGKPLANSEVDHFREWIASGAKSPKEETPELDPSQHWAFRRPKRPKVPAAQDDRWSLNPIDRFIRQQHQSHGLNPAVNASPEHLLRRVTLDLTGLPPTLDQMRTFAADPSPENYLRAVDDLLKSPHYGERWGRHWMDVWRYSDWYGRRQQNDVRNSAPQIWRWRDWIVNSLNADKSYARMIQEMLAADELAPTDDEAWPATGYLIRSYYSLNPNEWMRHNVEYTGKAFLGLTFNCAHCHDHKYDPIAHDDYFRMRAFFEPMGIRQDRVVGEPEPPPFEPYKYGGSRKVIRAGMVRIFDEKPDAATWFYSGGDERNKDKDRGSIGPGVPSFLNVPFGEIAPVELPAPAWYPGSRPAIRQAMRDECAVEIKAATTALQQAREKNIDTTELTGKLTVARDTFEAALQKAMEAGERGPVSGKQSLIMDALSGRRILQHALPPLKTLPDETTIAFKLSILKDSHFNFQLARDTSKSLTALYVGFVGGNIKAYRPGSFSEFVTGSYAPDEKQVMEVSLQIHPEADVAKLTVRDLSDSAQSVLVPQVDIALNGWDPPKNAHQPFTFDCRTGTQVLIDDVTVSAGDKTWSWKFEAPDFVDGRDVAGVQGWVAHRLATAGATSLVTGLGACQSAAIPYKAFVEAQAALTAANSPIGHAERRLEAAEKKRASLEATIAADIATYENATSDQVSTLARRAYSAQLDARQADARWQVVKTEQELAATRALPDSDKQKAARIKELEKQLSTAQKDLAAANDRLATKPDSNEYERLSPTTAPQSTGRRSALANWITHPANPLTPRVAINHIWMRHFHAPLVASVYDFGRNGKLPTHPELLDWLAVELVENGWSMKHIHRLIVTSRVYRMTSSARGLQNNIERDAENQQLWRMNAGRMEAEVVRDSVLAIAGTLDPTIGGEVRPNTEAATTFRRSLYYEIYPEDGGNIPMAEVFDAPDPGECFRRTTTVLPQQALALSNSPLIHSAAKTVAAKLSESTENDQHEFVTQAFQRVLSRTPSQRESAAASGFLDRQMQQLKSIEIARESLVRVLFNHNDFVTIR